jgi:hypothetical protein
VPNAEARAPFQVREIPEGIEVDLPSPRRPLTAVIVGVWLAGWGVGLAFLAQQLRTGEITGGDVAFLVAWSLVWVAMGPLAMAYLVWLLAGRERITLREPRLTIWRGVGRVGITREYALADVHELRTFGREVVPLLAAGLDFAGQGASGVRFRAGEQIVRFARALDESSAHTLVDRLRAVHPFAARTGVPIEPAA